MKHLMTIVYLSLVLTACTQATPSVGSIQTAIAQTQVAIPTPSTTPQPTISNKGAWVLSEDVSTLDNSTSFALGLSADKQVSGGVGLVTPKLVIRCKDGELNIFIVTGTYLRDYPDISYRLDNDQIITNPTDKNHIILVSSNNEALILYDAQFWLQELMQHKQFALEFEPYQSIKQDTVFDLTGLDQVVQSIRENCPP